MISQNQIRLLIDYMKSLHPDREFYAYEDHFNREIVLSCDPINKRNARVSMYHSLWYPLLNKLDTTRRDIKDILLWLIHGIDIEDAEIIPEKNPMQDFSADMEYARAQILRACGIANLN